MKKQIAYDMPFRPIYEFYSVFLWIGVCVVTVFFYKYQNLESPLVFMTAGISSLYALYRFKQGIHLFILHRTLQGKAVTYLTLQQLALNIAKKPEQLWLGEGFEWQSKHLQRVVDFKRFQSNNVIHDKALQKEMGAKWLHGINAHTDNLYQSLTHTEGHTLIVGTTGAGKTRCFDILITQAILRHEAVIIIDPKGDKALCENAKRACEFMGSGQKFIYFHPGFPEDSAKINPLKNFNRGTEIASRIAALIPSETGSDPFKAFGQMALNNIVQGLLIVGKKPDLRTLRYYLESGPEELVIQAVMSWAGAKSENFTAEFAQLKVKANYHPAQLAHYLHEFYFHTLRQKYPNSDLEGLLSMYKHDKTHYSKMVASLMPILNMLTSSELGTLLSPDLERAAVDVIYTDFAKIIQTSSVAYIGLDSLTDAMVGSAIGSLLLSDLTAVAGDRYNYGNDNKPVNIFIDEAAEVINDPFIQLLNKGRGAKMRCVIATQTFADFAARTGSEAKALQVLGNINNFLVFRVMDSRTQSYVTDNLPTVSIKSVNQDKSLTTKSEQRVNYVGGLGKSLIEEELPLFPKAMLGELPNLEYIAMISGGRILKGRLPILLG